MKSVNCSEPGYISTCITCLQIELIPYNLIFTTKFNDSLILIMIISWAILNLSLANEYVVDVTIPTQVIKYNQCCSRWISQSDCSIHIKLNDMLLNGQKIHSVQLFVYIMLDIVDYLLLVKQECYMPENNFIFNVENNCFIQCNRAGAINVKLKS